METKVILHKLLQQHFGYFDYEVTADFNIYDTKLTIDELSDFIVDLEESFSLDFDESELPLDNFRALVEYIDLQIAIDFDRMR